MTPNQKGAALMIAAQVAFTLNDTCIKLVGSAMPLFQIITLRGLLASILIGALAVALGLMRLRMSRRDYGLIALRGTAEAVATFFFLSALMRMPIANVTAVLQVLPLTVTLGAALVYREQIGWRRVLAICVGFLGMLLIVRPGPDGFSPYAIYALLAVCCVTVRDLVTRAVSPSVPSLTLTFLSSLIVLGAAAVASTTVEWKPLEWQNVRLLLWSAAYIMGGYFFSVQVMRVGEVSFTAPFRYTGVLVALIVGWYVFGDWPDNVTLLGAVIIVGAGLFMLRREQVKRAENQP